MLKIASNPLGGNSKWDTKLEIGQSVLWINLGVSLHGPVAQNHSKNWRSVEWDLSKTKMSQPKKNVTTKINLKSYE